MNEPHRWLEGASALSDLERRALERVRDVAAPQGSKDAVWASLAARLGHDVASHSDDASRSHDASGALGQATAATRPLAAVVGKTILVIPLVGAGFLAAWLLGTRHDVRGVPVPATESSRHFSQVSQPLTPDTANTTSEPDNPMMEKPGAADGRRERPPIAPAPPDRRGSTAPSEGREVASARDLLRSGDAKAALAALARIEAQFPRGTLSQEREALAIRALLALGERDAARRRTASFLFRYPDTPYRAALERAVAQDDRSP
jgi:hypothetical protein